MRRLLPAATTAVLMSLLVSPEASADFHPACLEAPRAANVSLELQDGDFAFSGTVSCRGADSITISSLTLRGVVGGSSGAAPEAACAGSCTTVTTGARAPAAPGLVEVHMVFIVEGNGGTYARTRTAQWTWAAAGDPTRTCPVGAAPAPFNACV